MNIYKKYSPQVGSLELEDTSSTGILIPTSADVSVFYMAEYSVLSFTDDYIIEFELDDTLMESESIVHDNKILIKGTISEGELWPI